MQPAACQPQNPRRFGDVAARAIQGLLFGVAPYDPATFGAVALVMAAIGIAASWIPAIRASRVDPAITMRAQ
jgi:ABC-type antimicrobial peptide transport system permease subunit